jgi:hypothetical protein
MYDFIPKIFCPANVGPEKADPTLGDCLSFGRFEDEPNSVSGKPEDSLPRFREHIPLHRHQE